MSDLKKDDPPLPPDDLSRRLAVAAPDRDRTLKHIGIVGDTYTVTISGAETAGRYCAFDMLIPPGGGPGPHRHDFEETFILLEGELQANFRGERSIVRAGDTVTIPANAPHQFHNGSDGYVRMLCVCAPAGQEEFFEQLGVMLPERDSVAPKLSEAEMEAFLKKAMELAPKYRTEMLKEI